MPASIGLPHAADGQTERPTGRRSPAKPSGRSGLARFVVAVMTPTNHRRAHPSYASPVTTSPLFIGIHGGVQQPVTAHRHPPLAESGRAIRRSRAGTVSDPWTTRAVSAVTVKWSFSGDPRWRAQVLVTRTCHMWMGAVGSDGYGRIAIRNPEDGPRTLTPHQIGRGQARVPADPRRRDPLACLHAGRPGRLPSTLWDGRHHRHRCRARGHAGSAQRLVRQAVSGRNPRPAQAHEQVVRQHHGRPDAPAGPRPICRRRGMNAAAVTCRPRGDHLAGGHHIRPRFRRALHPMPPTTGCTSSPLQRVARRCVRGGLQDADRPGRAGAPLVRVPVGCRSGQSVSGPEQYTQSSSHVGAPSRASRDDRVAIMVIKEVIPGRRAPRPTDACGVLQVGFPLPSVNCTGIPGFPARFSSNASCPNPCPTGLHVAEAGERDFSGEGGREHRVDPAVECPIGVDPNHTSGGHAASALTVVSGARVKSGYQRWKSSAS